MVWYAYAMHERLTCDAGKIWLCLQTRDKYGRAWCVPQSAGILGADDRTPRAQAAAVWEQECKRGLYSMKAIPKSFELQERWLLCMSGCANHLIVQTGVRCQKDLNLIATT